MRSPWLSRYLHRLRHAQGGVPERERPWQSSPVLAAAPRRVLTPRTATWLVLRRADKRSKEDQALLACMRAQAPDLDAAVGLAEAFTSLVRDRAPDRLDPWLKGVTSRFAQNRTLRRIQGPLTFRPRFERGFCNGSSQI